MRNVAIGMLGALVWCGVGLAQFQFGSVLGLVKDPSQAPVPGAAVEIRSKTTNVARQATTSPTGEYNFVSLPPDKYTITVRQQGFREVSRSIELSVDQRLQADIVLEVGGVNEEVTVKAEAPCSKRHRRNSATSAPSSKSWIFL